MNKIKYPLVPGGKECARCHKIVPLEEFPPSGRGLGWSSCRSCSNEFNKRYRKTPKGREIVKRGYKSYDRTESLKRYEASEKSKDIHKKYTVGEKGRASTSRGCRKYSQTEQGKEVRRQIKLKRRKLKKESLCNLTASEWLEIKEKFGHKCAYCRKKGPLTQDHLIPLSKGGDHSKENVVPACRSCNSRKGTKSLPDFLKKYPDLSLYSP